MKDGHKSALVGTAILLFLGMMFLTMIHKANKRIHDNLLIRAKSITTQILNVQHDLDLELQEEKQSGCNACTTSPIRYKLDLLKDLEMQLSKIYEWHPELEAEVHTTRKTR